MPNRCLPLGLLAADAIELAGFDQRGDDAPMNSSTVVTGKERA
jgi:hypothetical protein